MRKILMIDDMRNFTQMVDTSAVFRKITRDFFTGLQALMDDEWDALLLDHDLGPNSVRHGREWTGYDIMCWLERNPKYLPGKIICISANPVGKQKIETVIRKLYD